MAYSFSLNFDDEGLAARFKKQTSACDNSVIVDCSTGLPLIFRSPCIQDTGAIHLHRVQKPLQTFCCRLRNAFRA